MPAADSVQSSSSPAQAQRARRTIAFAGVFAATYLLALLATIPASVAMPNSALAQAARGTLWHGEVALDGGGMLEWRWAPLRTLTRLAFALDFTVAGGGADLAGQALLRPGKVTLDNVAGRADATLLRALAPRLPFDCALTMQVDVPHAAIGDGAYAADATVRSEPGTCQPRAGGATLPAPVPALILVARPTGRGGTQARITPREQRRRTLATFDMTADGRLAIRVTPSGAQVLPFAAPPGGISIDTRF